MKTLILVFACLLVTSLKTQAQSVSEEEISFEILKWHYHTYPKNEASNWSIIKVGGKEYYRVDFTFESRSYQAEYDQNGRITHEVVNLDETIPVSITHQLEMFDKYKVNSFLKVSDIQDSKVIYKLDIKVKSEGQKVLWYDENFIQVPNTDFSKSVTDLY